MINIKRSIVLLLSSLLTMTLCFSQTTYPKITKDSLIVITAVQLKQTNLIFSEHEHLKESYDLINQKCLLQDSINNKLQFTNNMQELVIDSLIDHNMQYSEKLLKIDASNKKLKKLNKGLTGFSIGSLLLLLLLL